MKRYFTRSSVPASPSPLLSTSDSTRSSVPASPGPLLSTSDSSSSSPPVNKRVRAVHADDPLSEEQLKKLERDFGREIKRLVQAARENKVVIPEFDFMAAVAGERQPLPMDAYKWLDGVPRVACSSDGYAMVVHVPGALKKVSADILLRQLIDFVHIGFKGKLSLVAGADGKTRDQANSYHVRSGQIAGLFKLVRAWLPIGHPHSNPVPSRDMLKTGTGFAASLDLVGQLRLVSHRVNCLIEEVDPVYFAQLRELHEAASKKHRFYDILGTKDPLYMEGRELMYNRQTPLHPDNSDPKTGWAVLVVVGPFTGGDLIIPCLNMRLLYNHGTIILIRGRVLPHEVAAFSNGQRVAIAHFTHTTFWKKFGMNPVATVFE